MDDDAKFARVIRVNVVCGTILLAMLGVSAVLMAVGFLPFDTSSIVRILAFVGIPICLVFLTAWAARRERAAARAATARRAQTAETPTVRG